MKDSLKEQVYTFVRTIPQGKVVTYGTVARAIGRPNAARAVGSILKRNPDPFYKAVRGGLEGSRQQTPCHRVIRADRRIGQYSGSSGVKEQLLKKEGVKIEAGKVHPAHIQPASLYK